MELTAARSTFYGDIGEYFDAFYVKQTTVFAIA